MTDPSQGQSFQCASPDGDETIFALSSGAGRAGVAVIRVSGAKAQDCLAALGVKGVEPRRARLTAFYDPETGDLLDRGLVLLFPAPHSFTGEDVVELQGHGSPATVDALLGVLGRLPGVRPAEPGEFSRRAFDNGKMDFTEIEGLADLIAAETPAQRRQALAQMDGALSRLYEGWRTRLITALAHMEAAIDFADEEEAEGAAEGLATDLGDLRDAMAAHLNDAHRGERLREGFRVVLAGPPNAGKSSLLNALSRSDAAIVSEAAGTTRDMVQVRMNLDGFPVTLIDTAGLRISDDRIEQEGVRRARAAAANADVVILLCDAQAPSIEPEARIDAQSVIRVANKCDLVPAPAGWLAISATRGDGLDTVMEAVRAALVPSRDKAAGAVLTRARHRSAVEDCVAALDRFLASTGAAGVGGSDMVLQAEDLRLAVRALGRIVGRVDVEDLLDIVFADFCIGK